MGRVILERARDDATDWLPSTALTSRRRWQRWIALPLALAVPVVMVSSLLWGIWNWSSAVPLDDEWLWALLLRNANGGMPWGAIWAPHNGHRIFLPTLIDLTLVQLTHWNRQVLMTFNLGVMMGAALLIGRCVWRTTRSASTTFWLIVPLSLLLFSWGSYESWFQPFQLVAYLAVFGLAVCLAAWVPRRDGRAPGWGIFALALAGAVLATFSFATGLMLWIAFLPSALIAGWRKTVVWLVAAVAAWTLYFVGFSHAGMLSAPQTISANKPLAPGALTAYVLAFLGAPLGFPDPARSLVLGAAGCAVLLVALGVLAWRRDRWRHTLIWVELALFALLAAGETAYARLDQGVAEAISSRYNMWAALWWVALCVLCVLSLRAWWPADGQGQWSRWIWRARLAQMRRAWRMREWPVSSAGVRLYGACQALVIAAICVAVLVVNGVGLTYTQLFVLPQQWHQDCVLRYQTAPTGCSVFYTDAGSLAFKLFSSLLRARHDAVFATGAVGNYPAAAATLPLVRYYNPRTMDHWATTDYFAPTGPDHLAAPPGYRPDLLVGYLYDTEQPGTAPLYSCLAWGHDYMLSRQADCEGQQALGIQGWLYNAPPDGILIKPLYRCLIGTNHFVSNQPNCEGFPTEGLLGWVLARPSP